MQSSFLGSYIELSQKPIRVETCNGPLCAGKQEGAVTRFNPYGFLVKLYDTVKL